MALFTSQKTSSGTTKTYLSLSYSCKQKAISLKLVRGFSEIAFCLSSIRGWGLPIFLRIFLSDDSIIYWIESLLMVRTEVVS